MKNIEVKVRNLDVLSKLYRNVLLSLVKTMIAPPTNEYFPQQNIANSLVLVNTETYAGSDIAIMEYSDSSERMRFRVGIDGLKFKRSLDVNFFNTLRNNHFYMIHVDFDSKSLDIEIGRGILS